MTSPHKELIDEINNKLIRKDGKLNSPAFRKFFDLIKRVKIATSYLPEKSSFTQRFWHLQNEESPPKCNGCAEYSNWSENSSKYPSYCSQKCAVTCDEAKERTRKQFKGGKLSDERRKEMSKNRLGKKHTEETKLKLSQAKMRELNPRFGKEPWNKGLFGPANPTFGTKRPGTGQKGIDNWMFGKSPSKKAGRGIYGNFNKIHFRSSLELMYLIYWHENDISIESAEAHKFRVKYVSDDGDEHNYSPDYYLIDQNIVVEIKPQKLSHTANLKVEAFKNQHPELNFFLGTGYEISDFIHKILITDKIKEYIVSGLLNMAEKQHTRLIKNYSEILRTVNFNPRK